MKDEFIEGEKVRVIRETRCHHHKDRIIKPGIYIYYFSAPYINHWGVRTEDGKKAWAIKREDIEKVVPTKLKQGDRVKVLRGGNCLIYPKSDVYEAGEGIVDKHYPGTNECLVHIKGKLMSVSMDNLEVMPTSEPKVKTNCSILTEGFKIGDRIIVTEDGTTLFGANYKKGKGKAEKVGKDAVLVRFDDFEGAYTFRIPKNKCQLDREALIPTAKKSKSRMPNLLLTSLVPVTLSSLYFFGAHKMNFVNTPMVQQGLSILSLSLMGCVGVGAWTLAITPLFKGFAKIGDRSRKLKNEKADAEQNRLIALAEQLNSKPKV